MSHAGSSARFLILVSLIALIIGAIGVATAMHAHLQTRMDTIAVMKSIGGRSSQILRISLIETSILGFWRSHRRAVRNGRSVRLPALLERFLQVRPEIVFTAATAVQGLAVGLLTTLLFTVPPLLSIREIRPALILRRDMAEVREAFSVRVRKSARALLLGAVVCIGLGIVAASLVVGSPKTP